MTKETKAEALEGLHRGVREGWWQGVDVDAMLPVREVSRADYHDTALWAHVWVDLGKFGSVKEAKRAGWDKPLPNSGTERIGTWIVRVTPPTVRDMAESLIYAPRDRMAIACDPESYADARVSQAEGERYEDAELARAGIRNIMVGATPVVMDASLTAPEWRPIRDILAGAKQ